MNNRLVLPRLKIRNLDRVHPTLLKMPCNLGLNQLRLVEENTNVLLVVLLGLVGMFSGKAIVSPVNTTWFMYKLEKLD